MRLLGVELTRLRWRRAVLLLLLACLVVPALIFAATAWNTRPVSGAELAQAQQQVERMRHAAGHQPSDPDLRAAPGAVRGPVRATSVQAQDGSRSSRGSSRGQPLDLAASCRTASWPTVIVLLAGLLMLVGTTFAGARLELRLDEQPAAVRAAEVARLGWPRRPPCSLVAAVASAVVLALFWTAFALAGLVARARHRTPRDGVHPRRERARRGARRVRGAGCLRADDALPQHRRHAGGALRGHAGRLTRPGGAGRQRAVVPPRQRRRVGARRRATTTSSPPSPARPSPRERPTAADDARSPRPTPPAYLGVLLALAVATCRPRRSGGATSPDLSRERTRPRTGRAQPDCQPSRIAVEPSSSSRRRAARGAGARARPAWSWGPRR